MALASDPRHSNPGEHLAKKDKKAAKKETAGGISEEEYNILNDSFKLILNFFSDYARFHDLSHGFLDTIKEYGPISSHDLVDRMKKFHDSESQFMQCLRGREQTLKTMEAVCMERFGAALRNLYAVRRVHDLVHAIDLQQKYKNENLKRHSGYPGDRQQELETAVVVFTLAPGRADEAAQKEDLDTMRARINGLLKDRDQRVAVETLALRAVRQMLKITIRNEEQVKNWRGNRDPQSHQ